MPGDEQHPRRRADGWRAALDLHVALVLLLCAPLAVVLSPLHFVLLCAIVPQGLIVTRVVEARARGRRLLPALIVRELPVLVVCAGYLVWSAYGR